MTSTDILEKQKQGYITDQPKVGQDLEEGAPAVPDSGVVEQAIMPEIRGLEVLKEGTYAVDLEKTITEMYAVIKSMETQLQKVLAINTALEEDLDASKAVIAELKLEKSQHEETIARMQEQMPSKRELQIEVDHLVDERNATQGRIRDLKLRLAKAQETVTQQQDRIAGLADEKSDGVSEVSFLESKLNRLAEKIREYEREKNVLEGEKLVYQEKIDSLKNELNGTREEKYALLEEISETSGALEQARSAVAEAKLAAKKAYYKGAEK